MTDIVQFGLISYAHLHTPRYAAAIGAHPQANLAGIATLGANPHVARAEATRLNLPYYEDYRKLLEQAGLQAVYLGCEPHHHRVVILAAAQRNIHVLCDKPLATNLPDGEAIVQAARRYGVKLMVPFNPRFQLPVMKVKQALQSGEAGDLVAIYAVKHGRLPIKAPGPQSADWFLDPRQAGGGGFMDIGIHAIDALRWLAGAEAHIVYAHIGAFVHPDLPTDDLGTLTVEFTNGVVGVLNAGWANPDGFPTWLDVRFEVLATRQTFLIKSPYHDYSLFTARRHERRYWWRRDIDLIVDDFIQSILQRREPAITGEDALAALRITLAAYESSRTGQPVSL
jgi:UDP-N-acetylglucosamine 3-dehydrogenase